MAEHSVDEKYWSGGLECAPRDEIRALQEEKLKEQAEYIYAHSRFWRGQFEKAKMRPEDIRTIEDLAKVPYMHKEVHTAHLEKEGSIFGGLLCRPLAPFDTRQRFGLIEDFKPTVTVTTPSYILHMAATAREMGIDLKSLGLKFILIGGEPCPDASKKRIEELFDLPGGTRNFMGISELSPPCICGIECEEQDGFHTTSEDTMIYQFLKPDSSEPAKPGEESELVLTSLVQRTLITGFNFRTRDLCIYDDTPCKCGRTSPRFRIIGRHDDMVSISGVNIFASLIEDIVRKIPELGDEFQLVIENRGELSKVTVKVEPQPDTDPTRHPELKKKLEGAITDALTIKLPVEFVEFGSLPRFELKAKRWLDLRENNKATSQLNKSKNV
jgi:phenylacetate-CoA ligase